MPSHEALADSGQIEMKDGRMFLERRTFLKSIGLLGAGSLAGCTSAPLEKLHAYLTPPEDIVPGVAAYYATVCRACPAGCGIVAKTREARPIKLEGNPAHSVNRGALCARGQAFIQSLYSRYRVPKPLIRVGGQLQETTWDAALEGVSSKFQSASSLGFLTGLESGSFEDLLKDFLGRFPNSAQVVYEPGGFASWAKAAELLYSKKEVPQLDFTEADYLVSFGADFLDSWYSPVQLSLAWASRHAFQTGRSLEFDYVGPRRNLTATAADGWLVLPPQAIGAAVLALLYELLELKRSVMPAAQLQPIEKLAALFGPRPSADVVPAQIKTMAQRLAEAQAGTVIYGGQEVRTAETTAIHLAVLLVNHLAGAIGRTIKFGNGQAYSKLDPESKVVELVEAARSGRHDVLFIYGTNPAGTLPKSLDVARRIDDAKFVVALAWEHNETTALADAVLPVHHPLESWGDYEINSQTAGLMQPVRVPLYDSMLAGDLLIKLASLAHKPLRFDEYKKYVSARWLGKADAPTAASDWEALLIKGGRFQAAAASAEKQNLALNSSLKIAPLGVQPGRSLGSFTLIAPSSHLLFDGRGASQDWLMETPDTVLQTTWEIPLEVSQDAADHYQLKDGDQVKVQSPSGDLQASVVVTPDLEKGTLALRMGGGRKYARENLGNSSVMALIRATADPLSGDYGLVQEKVTLTRIGAGKLVKVTGTPYTDDRYLCLAVSLKNAQAGRFPKMTRHGEEYPDAQGRVQGELAPMPHEERPGSQPHDNITELQEHPDHRWGLVVDLDKCTGCGACVVACYAENNVPVVGREEAGRRRTLAWLQIEKHISVVNGKDQVRWLPVMCQQCDNAPCEPVCPVFAAHHTADGLNAQIYNRCVGTRYCANNCPYKVRRFNFFDYVREQPANQQLNPDVTVRSRGVMEKCTFCIQRIREAQNRAKAAGRKVHETEITPACVETCPTRALVFGDFLNPEGAMARLARSPRGYRLLDYITNTRPGVVYLRKVYTEES